MVEPVRHRQTKGAETDMFEPKATASHLDSTQSGRSPNCWHRYLGSNHYGNRSLSDERRSRLARVTDRIRLPDVSMPASFDSVARSSMSAAMRSVNSLVAIDCASSDVGGIPLYTS